MAGGAVYIATTEGPVRVLQVRQDRSLEFAVLHHGFASRAAFLASDYRDFVGREYGFVERETGTRKYRARLSNNIVRGDSWRAGMLAAHALAHCGMLHEAASVSEPDAPMDTELEGADFVIWATGNIEHGPDGFELLVKKVSQVRQKLVLSEALFDACARLHLPVHVLIPKANRAEDVEAALQSVRAVNPDLAVRYLDRMWFSAEPWTGQETRMAEASTTVEVEPPVLAPAKPTGKRSHIIAGVGIALFALAVVAAGAYVAITRKPAPAEPAKTDVVVTAANEELAHPSAVPPVEPIPPSTTLPANPEPKKPLAPPASSTSAPSATSPAPETFGPTAPSAVLTLTVAPARSDCSNPSVRTTLSAPVRWGDEARMRIGDRHPCIATITTTESGHAYTLTADATSASGRIGQDGPENVRAGRQHLLAPLLIMGFSGVTGIVIAYAPGHNANPDLTLAGPPSARQARIWLDPN
jgi:hypothetical protein